MWLYGQLHFSNFNKHQMYVATLLADKLTYVRVLYLCIAIYIFDMYVCMYIAVLVRMHAYLIIYA